MDKITFGSVPPSDRVHVVERIRALDGGAALVNEVTITDHVMHARPGSTTRPRRRARACSGTSAPRACGSSTRSGAAFARIN